jgi:GNAT superfamily N-acetyltransferase
MDPKPRIRLFEPGDESGASNVCLKTGDHGADGEPFYQEDPDALSRIYVGPYLAFEPELALILEDELGLCGYALGTADSRKFFGRYESEWRPNLVRSFTEPKGNPSEWNRIEEVYHLYHHPDYFTPEPYELYPAHLHIDLLPRAQGRGHGRALIETLVAKLAERRLPGVHLGMSASNERAYRFYKKLNFVELVRDGEGNDESIYMGRILND